MSVRVVVILGVVLVVLFVASVVLGACNNNNTGRSDLTKSTSDVQVGVGGFMARPLANHKDTNGDIVWPEVREGTPCIITAKGCPVGSIQAHILTVVKSDDIVRRVRRATFAQLQPGSTNGSAMDAVFTPLSDDPSAGEVRSKA